MSVPTSLSSLVSVTAGLSPAPTTESTLGEAVILTTDPLEGDGPGSWMSFATAADVDAAVAASEIGSTTSDNLKSALAQYATPGGRLLARIYVVAYTTGGGAVAPGDALQLAIDAGLNVGGFMLQSNTEADQEALAVWLSSDPQRLSRYMMIAQSADTGLYGGSKPASLSDLAILNCRVIYAADTSHVAAAALAWLCGTNLRRGPLGARSRIRGGYVSLTALTSSQAANVLGNDAGYLAPFGVGSQADVYNLMGTKAYSGDDWKSAVTLIYAARQCRAALSDAWLVAINSGRPVIADRSGMAIARDACGGVLEAMWSDGNGNGGHFTPNADMPHGYQIDTSIETTGDDAYIKVDVTIRVGREALRFDLSIQGEVV